MRRAWSGVSRPGSRAGPEASGITVTLLPQPGSDDLGGALVGGTGAVRVHPQGDGTAAAVAEAAGGGAQVDAAGEHLGGVVMPQAVDGAGNSGGRGDLPEPLADRVRVPRRLAEPVG